MLHGTGRLSTRPESDVELADDALVNAVFLPMRIPSWRGGRRRRCPKGGPAIYANFTPRARSLPARIRRAEVRRWFASASNA